LLGSLIAVPLSRGRLSQWRVPLPTLLVGIYGLFGFHFLLFLALRTAPAVEANLVNYLWPLLIVVLAPLFHKGTRLHWRQLAAALAGFSGAVLAITGGRVIEFQFSAGYWAALASAIVWASYSLMTQRVPAFHTSAIGSFGLVSGLLSLACHFVLEAPVMLSTNDALLLTWMGLGPLGLAFYLWDAALKKGRAQQIGLLSFLTPLGSTVLLFLDRQEALTAAVACAAVLIVGGAWLGRSVSNEAANDPYFETPAKSD
jgi:drug/metabolite transporter (DMT)-like permease